MKRFTLKLSATQILNLQDLLATQQVQQPDGKIHYGHFVTGNRSIAGIHKRVNKLWPAAMNHLDALDVEREKRMGMY